MWAYIPRLADILRGNGRSRWVASILNIAATLVSSDTLLQILIIDGPVLRAPRIATWQAQGMGLGPPWRTPSPLDPPHPPHHTSLSFRDVPLAKPAVRKTG
jgi:hypothetical protein